MILEIDMGNSRIKWRLRGESGKVAGGVEATGVDARGSGPWPASTWDWLAAEVAARPEQIWVGSVLSAAYNNAFGRWAESVWQSTPRFAHSRAFWAGVRNGYRQPEQLGVDRWLSMLAAYHHHQRGGPCLVANCGTALTLDLIDAEGRHLGGYIGPGLRLMRESLGTGTLALAAAGDTGALPPTPGRDSAACVSGGLMAMACGMVARGREQLAATGAPAAPALFLAGGDAAALAPWIEGAEVVPELVLDGLSLALALED